MKNRLILILSFLVLMLFSSGTAFSTPVTFIEQGSTWNYHQFSSPDLWPNWSNADINTFNWDDDSITWLTGNAAFGNDYPSGLVYNTLWDANTDLALWKNFTIDGALTGDLTLNVASDNGFIIAVNGIQIAKENAEGYTSYWEYTFSLSNTPFLAPGTNYFQVLAEDHGVATFFDLKLSGDVAPVPEPGTLLLLGSGLAGLALYRRRMNKV